MSPVNSQQYGNNTDQSTVWKQGKLKSAYLLINTQQLSKLNVFRDWGPWLSAFLRSARPATVLKNVQFRFEGLIGAE